MNNIVKTVERDSRRNPKLNGPNWLAQHCNVPDLNMSTDYEYTIGEMLWAHHKYTVENPFDETLDPTNMLDRVEYARKQHRATTAPVPQTEVEWDAIFGQRR